MSSSYTDYATRPTLLHTVLNKFSPQHVTPLVCLTSNLVFTAHLRFGPPSYRWHYCLYSGGQSGIQVHILHYRRVLILYYTEKLRQLFAYRIFRETF
jgi:hypothetical protein